LTESVQPSMSNLENKILSTFYEWKGNEEQVDDVCLIAIRR
jgi:hypothetical protein